MSVLAQISSGSAAPGDSCGDLDDIGSGRQRGVISPQKSSGQKRLLSLLAYLTSLSNPVEKKRLPVTAAKQTCSSSPVQRMWNRVTQIWMETIANISQRGLWKTRLTGPLIRELN